MDFSFTEDSRRHPPRRAELCRSYPGQLLARPGPARKRYPSEPSSRRSPRPVWLAALIPEEYGGAGLGITEASIILEEINRSGGNAGACHAQMYTMGTLLRHGSAEQKQRYPAAHRQWRAPPAGVRRHRAECRLGDDAHPDARRPQGRPLRRERPEDLHLARAQSDLMLLLARTTPYDELTDKTRGSDACSSSTCAASKGTLDDPARSI